MGQADNFLQRYGDRTLQQLVSDWRDVTVDAKSGAWAKLPPADFLEFCRQYPRTPFDGIPEAPHHLKTPTYLVSQAHRLWVTCSLIHERSRKLGAERILDMGSFPYFTPLILRDYFGFTGEITATTNLVPAEEGRRFLESKRIDVRLLDLDPFVRDPDDPTALPRELEGSTGRFDLVSSTHVIEHLYHPKAMVSECHRVLRSGGEFVVTTDNAMMLDTLLNFVSGYGYTFEPIEQTAAMHFSFWRGHVRFFTDRDLKTILQSCGLEPCAVEYAQCFYDVLFPEYFREPEPKLQRFRAKMLAETPWLRNEIAMVGRKA